MSAPAAYDIDPNTITMKGTHFIGGQRVDGAGQPFDVRRPSDGQVYGYIPCANLNEVDAAVENAAQAFRESGWATMPPRDRMKILRRWADLIDADVEGLAPLEAVGSTRPLADVKAWDIPFTAEGIRFYAEFADKMGGDVAATSCDKLGLIIAEPYGVIGAISPWNLPLVMGSWKVAPALAAGNAVVLKPSELTPFSMVRLAELAITAGIPAGIFNVIQGFGHEAGDALVRHPKIAKVTFTGSTRTGSAIMAACAQSGPKPVTLELGGKSPQVVFDDIKDLDKVAATIARAITLNAGQVCVAGSRLIVQAGVADKLIERVTAIFKGLRAGPTWDSAATLPPIISDKQWGDIDAIVKRTLTGGAELITGSGRAEGPSSGAYYTPTILSGVHQATEAVREELFGPVLTVQTFADEDEAYALANDTQYGLAAGIFTSDLERALRGMRRLEAGTVWINRYGRSHDFILPTGGYKRSGIGKDLGRQAFEANLKFKTALIEF